MLDNPNPVMSNTMVYLDVSASMPLGIKLHIHPFQREEQ